MYASQDVSSTAEPQYTLNPVDHRLDEDLVLNLVSFWIVTLFCEFRDFSAKRARFQPQTAAFPPEPSRRGSGVRTMKHLAISKWLTQLGLPEYCMLFDDEYDGVEDLLHLTELDLQQLGIHNRLHRVHILSSIQILQERERRRGQSTSSCENRLASVFPQNLRG
ncbi:hypothetical protein AGOR_G00149080 [Albula goreensis]|uniref:SAM domain-containing protein n=1 Tax=Albula goreensis TaxID=1534307 RepID=A0A8T3D2U3_9TELE|nr:hypothetical protein AGOR_G00149080 [Albula goreensis]